MGNRFSDPTAVRLKIPLYKSYTAFVRHSMFGTVRIRNKKLRLAGFGANSPQINSSSAFTIVARKTFTNI